VLKASARIEILSDFSAIDNLSWNRLVVNRPGATFFQTLAWQRAWWETFARGQLLLLATYQGGRLSAVAPLFADGGMVFFVGSGGSDYLDFLGDPASADVLPAMLDAARAHTADFVGFRFYHVPDASPTPQLLAKAAAELDLDFYEEGSLDAPALRFAQWPESKRPPAEKTSLVRHERNLRKHGELKTEHFTRSEDILPLLPDFFAQHVERWKGTAFPSLFLQQDQCAFYRNLTKRAGPEGWLRFSRVTLDGQPIAFHFGFCFDGRFLWYKPSFDPAWSRCSPGEVLLRSLLMRAQSEDSEVFDFGLGNEAFKSRFATEVPEVRTWGLYTSHGGGLG
jgi:CelD/BcsL family acetyltransferase involved in cellulose biosynthesis